MQVEYLQSFSKIQGHSSNQMNCEIMESIKKAKQKLNNNNNRNVFQKGYGKQNIDIKIQPIYNEKSSLVQKTINTLKVKINRLQQEKNKQQYELVNYKKNHQSEVQMLKIQLAKYVQKQLQASIKPCNNKGNNNDEQLNKKLRLKQIQFEHINEKLMKQCQKRQQLQRILKQKCKKINELQLQKQKHIQLNILDKIRFEQQTKQMNSNLQKKNKKLKKLEQENINLKKQIHSIFNKDRMQKNNIQFNQKTKQNCQFQIRQIKQKYTIKIEALQKQIQALKQMNQKLKNITEYNHKQNKYIHIEKQLQIKKQLLLQKDQKLSFKIIEIQKLSSNNQNLQKNLKQKQAQIKKLNTLIEKKQIHQKQLIQKLTKNGLQAKQFKQTIKYNPKLIKQKVQQKHQSQSESNKSFEIQQVKQIKRLPPKPCIKSKESTIEQIVKQQRILAGLKSNYNQIDRLDSSSRQSLNQMMHQIRRRSQKLSSLRENNK